nr:MAG TPA: hypothetical protein [Caudoviricetes sp.]
MVEVVIRILLFIKLSKASATQDFRESCKQKLTHVYQ